MGTIAMGPLMQLAVNYLGWAHAARVLGGILSLCTIGSLLYKVPSQTGKDVEKVEEPIRKKPPMFDFTIFKNKAFLIYCLSLSAFMMGYFVPFVHLVSNLVPFTVKTCNLPSLEKCLKSNQKFLLFFSFNSLLTPKSAAYQTRSLPR